MKQTAHYLALTLALFAGLGCALTGCCFIGIPEDEHYLIVSRRKVVMNGESLPYTRTIELSDIIDQRFLLDLPATDITLRGIDGHVATLHIQVQEKITGDARIDLTPNSLDLSSSSHCPIFIRSIVGEIPRSLDLDLNTGSGDITIENLSGENTVRIRTGGGDVQLSELNGLSLISIETGSGSVRLRSGSNLRKVMIETGRGRIYIEQLNGINTLSLDSSAGDIHLLRVSAGETELDTGIGDIILDTSSFSVIETRTGRGIVIER